MQIHAIMNNRKLIKNIKNPLLFGIKNTRLPQNRAWPGHLDKTPFKTTKIIGIH